MLTRIFFGFIPYITVGAGLFVFKSAWWAMGLYHAAIVGVLVFRRYFPVKELSFGRGRGWIVAGSVVVGGIGGLVLWVLWPYLSVDPGLPDHIGNIGLTASSWPFFMAYYILVNPLLEELFWRGFLTNDLTGLSGNGVAKNTSRFPTIGDGLFAGYHLLVLGGLIGVWWLVVVFFTLTGAAWYWRQTNRLSGGLLNSFLSHTAADITVILAIYFMTQAG